jgi:hypothetical protein
MPARRFAGTRHLLYPFPGTTMSFLISCCNTYSFFSAHVFNLLGMIVTSFSGDNIDAAVDYRTK